jgi:hypothetical protein
VGLRRDHPLLRAGRLLLALGLVAAHGCGGSGSSNSRPSPAEMIKQAHDREYADEAKRRALAAASTPAPPPAPPRPPRAEGQAPKSPQMPEAWQAGRPKTPARPRDPALWTPEDCRAARRDGDPHLTAAVALLGARRAGKQAAAEVLAKLLVEPPAPDAKLAAAIVAALAANDTPEARQTLARLVVGSVKSADTDAVATAAMKALAASPCLENDDLLFRAVIAAGPQRLGHAAVASISSMASRSLRLRLAEYMIGPESSQAACDQLWSCLKESRPENLSAQVVLYRSGFPDEETRKRMERWFAAQSSEAGDRLLGVPAAKQRPSESEHAGLAAEACHAAIRLWNPELAAAIERRLEALDAVGRGTEAVTLAATMPTPTMRTALLHVLQRHWDEGPKALDGLVAIDGLAAEPGFLVSVKMLPRKDPPGPAGKDSRGHENNRSASPAKSAKLTEIYQAKRLQEETAQRWMQFSQSLMRAMCGRLRAAAQSRRLAGTQAQSETDLQLPMKLHPRADLVAAYRLNWPESLAGEMAAAPLLRVRYVRLALKAPPARVVAFFRRQLPDCQQHESPSGIWLDSLDDGKRQANARSVDVLVARTSARTLGPASQEQELTVEVLSIECEPVADRKPLSASR